MILENLSFTTVTTAANNVWNATKRYVFTTASAEETTEDVALLEQEHLPIRQKRSRSIDYPRLIS